MFKESGMKVYQSREKVKAFIPVMTREERVTYIR